MDLEIRAITPEETEGFIRATSMAFGQPPSDEDLARPVEENFRQEGIEVYTGTQLHRFSRQGELNTAHFSHADQEKTAERDRGGE